LPASISEKIVTAVIGFDRSAIQEQTGLLRLRHVLAIGHAARVIKDKTSAFREGHRHGGYTVLPLERLRVLHHAPTSLILAAERPPQRA
jgi:hypothetical protein